MDKTQSSGGEAKPTIIYFFETPGKVYVSVTESCEFQKFLLIHQFVLNELILYLQRRELDQTEFPGKSAASLHLG